MKIKSKTLGLIFGSIAIGTTAIVPAVVLSSCAEDVSTTITINQTLSNQIVEKINGIATLDGQLDTDAAKKKLEDSKGTVATIIGVTNASDISTIEVTTTSIVITIQNKSFTVDSTGFIVAKNDTWKTPEIKITTEANKITLSSTTPIFKQGTGSGTDNNQQPSTPTTITQDQANKLGTEIKTACVSVDGTVAKNVAEEKLIAAKEKLATAVGLTAADIKSITVKDAKTITIDVINKTLEPNSNGLTIADPAGKVTTTKNTIVVTGTSNLFLDKIQITEAIANSVGEFIQSKAPFTQTAKGTAQTELNNFKTEILNLLKSTGTIDGIVVTQKKITINASGTNLADVSNVVSKQFGSVTLKFSVSGSGSNIAIEENGGGDLYTA